MNPTPQPGKRAAYFVLFLALSSAVYLVGVTFSGAIPDGLETALRLGMALAFLLLALGLRSRDRSGSRWSVFYALFVASVALFVSWRFSHIGNRILGLTLESAPGLAMAKLSSAILTIAAVVLLARLGGDGPQTLFLRAGKLKPGLIVGISAFVVLCVLSTLQALSGGMSLQLLLAVLPWILVFIFANGFLEEILFRGLFLGRLEPLVGRWPAVLLTAVAFTAAHMQVEYTPDLIPFLAVLLGLAVAWGYLMQRTQSVIGSAIFHAGADTLIILQIFAAYGVSG